MFKRLALGSRPLQTLTRVSRPPFSLAKSVLRQNSTNAYESKYSLKLRRRAEEKNMTVDELKAQMRIAAEETRRIAQEAAAAERAAKAPSKTLHVEGSEEGLSDSKPSQSQPTPVQTGLKEKQRKDGAPIQPLSSFLNVSRIMETPHTPEQVSALWLAYHASRSGGTGRGYICASIPVDIYNRIASIADRYRSFVVPIPRVQPPPEESETQNGDQTDPQTAYEFFFLQWDFYDSPPTPSADPFVVVQEPSEGGNAKNPPTSTVLFTPLQEYKTRGAYATPYLVLTHYTDLVNTHGIVLLRGEITPSSSSVGAGVDGRYLLTQEDAQILGISVQKYFLWRQEGGNVEGERLLKTFHEHPEEFKWEELIKNSEALL